MSETIEKKVLNEKLSEFDKNIGQLFMLMEKEIDKDCLKMSMFALFGFRTKLSEQLEKLKELTKEDK